MVRPEEPLKTWVWSACAALTMTLAGCDDSPSAGAADARAPAELEQQQSALFQNLSLGRGVVFSPAAGGPLATPAPSSCMQGPTSTALLNRLYSRTFTSTTRASAKTSLDIDFGVDLSLADIQTSAGNIGGYQNFDVMLDATFENLTTSEAAFIVVRYESVLESLGGRIDEPTGLPFDGNLDQRLEDVIFDESTMAPACPGGPVLKNSIKDFVLQCGTHYISDKTHGAVLVLSFDMRELSDEAQGKLQVENEVGLNGPGELASTNSDIAAQLQFIQSNGGNSLKFRVLASGANLPSAVIDSDNQIAIGDLIAYLNALQNRTTLADPQTWGSVLYANTAPFAPNPFYRCVTPRRGPDPELYSAYRCYMERSEADQKYLDFAQKLRANAQARLNALDDNVALMPEPEMASRDLIDGFIAEVDQCLLDANDITQNACESAFDAINACSDPAQDVGSVCDPNTNLARDGSLALCPACELSESCNILELSTKFNALPEPIEVTIARGSVDYFGRDITPGASMHAELGEVHENVCTWSRIKGRFRGTAESVELYADAGEWYAKADSSFTSNRRALEASVVCAPKFDNEGASYFQDTGVARLLGDPLNPSSDADGNTGLNDMDLHEYVANATSSSQGAISYTLDGVFAPFLRGFAGDFRGLGDAAYVRDSGNLTDPLEVVAQSNSSGTLARGGAFGLTMPFDKNKRTTSFSVSTVVADGPSKTLHERDRSMCVLTGFEGEMDTNKEGFYLRSNGDFWLLNVYAGCDQRAVLRPWVCKKRKPVLASVLCYEFDQTDPQP